jgi:hypothetical protein
MPFIHFPVVEIIHYLMKLRHNRPFMQIGRIFILSLVVISAISYTGVWVKAFDPNSPPCIIGKWECYQGPPLSFPEFVLQLGAPVTLFLLPVIDLFGVLLLLFRPSRTYLILLFVSFISIFVIISAQPNPYIYFKTGSGTYVHLFCTAIIFFLSFPLALDEQVKLYPNWDYRRIFPRFMFD